MSMSDDEQFNQAFGEHTGISKDIRYVINNVRQLARNKRFTLYFSQSGLFSKLSWRLLGRYISSNNHLEELVLGNCNLTDENMALLFSELSSSKSLTQLWLAGNEFGKDGLRSMVPFLQNSPDLVHITLSRNNNINTECFELLLHTLHRRPLEGATLEFQLSFSECGITNISALERYPLQNLSTLYLNGNNIGREGCITISNLLQQEGSNLTYLNLGDTGIDDEGAEIIASSLKHNTKLRTFLLEESHRRASDNPPSPQTRNNIAERGYKAFLKLIFNVSSIENMYKSNHTLRALYLPECSFGQECKHIIKSIYEINSNPSSHAAVKAKVIKYQLNNQNRKDLCRLQGVEYTSIGNLFPDIEPVLLPRILAMIGSSHGHSEFYRALIPMVPDLMSCVDTSGMRKDLIAQNSTQMAELTRQHAALSAKNDQLSGRLAVREKSSVSRQKTDVGSTTVCGKKRQRS